MEVWSTFPNGTFHSYAIPVNYHQCTKNDLQYFYPIHRETEKIERIFLEMFCLDVNQTIRFAGDWDAQTAIFLVVDFQECFNSVKCYNSSTKKALFELYFSYTIYNT